MMLRNLLKLFGCWLQRYPARGNAVLTGILLGTGDFLAQKLIDKKEKYNFERTAKMAAIGALYLGPSISTWYIILDKTVGMTDGKKKTKVLTKIALDQILFAPVLTSGFIAINAVCDGRDPKEEVTKKLPDIMLANWKLWPFVQFINFSYVPLHLRTALVQFVAVFWNTYLAWKVNS